MKTLQINTKTDADGHLRLDIPTTMPSANLSLLLVWSREGEGPKSRIADLVGRLQWRGDAVAVQQQLRSEWA